MMKAGGRAGKRDGFQFVLDELLPLRPAARQMFGFTYVYLGGKLLLALRDSARQPQYNGVWLFTQAGHIESLRREFPLLPRRFFWRSAKSGSGWVILASGVEEFEEYAFRACELILTGDQRFGRVTRGSAGATAATGKGVRRPRKSAGLSSAPARPRG